MARSSITISDIAKQVGVSTSTVSRVLNGSGLVASNQRHRILEAAERLGYQKRQRRRQAGRTILTVALVLPDNSPGPLHLFYDAGELVDSVHEAFGQTRLNVVVVTASRWRSTFEQKKMGDLDGCILAFTDPGPDLERHLEENAIPTVSLNRIYANRNYVSCDNRNGMELLVEQVTRIRGREHAIAYIDYRGIPPVARERRAGFLSGTAAQGMDPEHIHVFEIDHLSQINDRLFKELEMRSVGSVMCFNDVVAVYVYQGALHRGIRIPENLSLTGFDNSPVRQLLDRTIDTVDLGAGTLAGVAAEWLHSSIIKADSAPIRMVLDAHYVPGSTL
ncbi:MAG: LacI family DNA-binding transcriptional regulator [Spirochaetota bacterium]